MIRSLRLGAIYFAGRGGVRVVLPSGDVIDRAEGYQLSLDRWPASIEGQLVDSRGRLVTVAQDAMRRRYEDKAITL